MMLGEDAHDQVDLYLVVALRLQEDLDQEVAQLSHDQVVLCLVELELLYLAVLFLVVLVHPYPVDL